MDIYQGGHPHWQVPNAATLYLPRAVPAPSYSFSVDQIYCDRLRSPALDSDNLHISTSVAVGNRPPVTSSKSLGDHKTGAFSPDLPSLNVSVADDEVVVFTYLIVNNGTAQPPTVLKGIEHAALSLAGAGATAGATAVGNAAVTAACTAMGALLGSAVPIVGTIVGAVLGKLSSMLIGAVISKVDPNCDGPVASAALTMTGLGLRETLEGHTEHIYNGTDDNPGIVSRPGCGQNSMYHTSWIIRQA